jgi:hypothetical protein
MIPTLITGIAGFIIRSALKLIIFNKGKSIPKEYSTHKLINKVSESYSNQTDKSNKKGLSALLDARKALLSDINKLTTSDYTVKIPKALPEGGQPFNKEAALESLQDSFVKKYPNLPKGPKTI